MLIKFFTNDFWLDREANQAIFRLILSVLVTFQIGYGIEMSYYPQRLNEFYLLAISFNTFSVASLISLKYYPHSETRTYLSIPADVIGVSCAMMLTDAGPFSPLFLLYPWMYVSYAVRYGIQHLYYVAISCISAFLVILAVTDSWYSHSLDAVVYLTFLFILPLYLKIILKRIITEREEKELALKTRNEFLATMSHEIRTPMSGIVGMTTLLERTDLNKQQSEYISSLRDTSTVLHSLIDDVLDLSKLEANKTQLDLHTENIQETVQAVIHMLSPRAKAKNLEVNSQYNNIPERVIIDANRLRQILLNLISNAIKFTQNGHVLVKVSGLQKENKIWDVKFEIIDTGSGIEQKHLNRIFEAFYQCNQVANLPHQGTGLGTAIAKELVELMGGKIGVSSTYNQGSSFSFQLPLAETCQQAQDCSLLKKQSQKKHTSVNVLVAEDNPINAKIITTFLEDEGHNVDLVDNGKDALKQLRSSKYDIVFMDMRMPIISGPDATKQWREVEKDRPHTPIIALTANASPADRLLCIESGMDDFLVKPVSSEQLNNIIQKYI